MASKDANTTTVGNRPLLLRVQVSSEMADLTTGTFPMAAKDSSRLSDKPLRILRPPYPPPKRRSS